MHARGAGVFPASSFNDLHTGFSDHTNNDAWDWTAQGMLVGADGGRVHFDAVLRITWKPDGSMGNFQEYDSHHGADSLNLVEYRF